MPTSSTLRAALGAAVLSLAGTAGVGSFPRPCVAAAAAAAPPATAPAARPVPYVEPDLRAWVFDPAAMQAPSAARSRAAELLAQHVAHDLTFDAPGDVERAARALGLALRIDPQSRPAVLANLALRRGRRPGGTPPPG